MGSFIFDIFVLITFLLILAYIIFVAIHTYGTNMTLFWISIGLAIWFFALIIWNIIELANDVYSPLPVVHTTPITNTYQTTPITNTYQTTPITQSSLPVVQTTPINNYDNLPVIRTTPI
jgi:hypothetical protein